MTNPSTLAALEAVAKCIRAEEIARRLGKAGILTVEIESLMREHGFWPEGATREELGWHGAWEALWNFIGDREKNLSAVCTER